MPSNPKLFITGPIQNRTADQLQEFSIVKEKLEAHGYQVTTCIEAMGGFENINIYLQSHEDYLKLMRKRVSTMLICDIVLKLSGWDDEIDSRSDSFIAGYLNQPCFDAFSFIESANQRAIDAETPKK